MDRGIYHAHASVVTREFAFGGGESVPIGTIALRTDLNYNKFTFKNGLPFTPGGTGGTVTTDDLTQEILGGLANITIPFRGEKLNNVYTDKKFISNQELKALQFDPITFGFVF